MRKIFTQEELASFHPSDIAERLSELGDIDRLYNFYNLPKELKVKVFSYLNSQVQRSLIEALGDTETREIVNAMAPDDRTEFFLDLPDELIKEMMNLLGEKKRKEALKLLGYPEDSVARLMTPYYIRVRKDWTVQHVLDLSLIHI